MRIRTLLLVVLSAAVMVLPATGEAARARGRTLTFDAPTFVSERSGGTQNIECILAIAVAGRDCKIKVTVKMTGFITPAARNLPITGTVTVTAPNACWAGSADAQTCPAGPNTQRKNFSARTDAQGHFAVQVGPFSYTDSGISPACWDMSFVLAGRQGSTNGRKTHRESVCS